MSEYVESISGHEEGVCLFENAEELWFWFMKALKAKADGAVCGRSFGGEIRPCEPNDVYLIITRLHRNRRLLMDHLRVLSHYGKRGLAPAKDMQKEQRSYYLWIEAIEILEEAFKQKKLLKPQLYVVKRS